MDLKIIKVQAWCNAEAKSDAKKLKFEVRNRHTRGVKVRNGK